MQDQLEQHLRANVTLNVYLYYGSERNRSKQFLSSQDVVITTYNVLSSDFGVSGEQVKCIKCVAARWTKVFTQRTKLGRLMLYGSADCVVIYFDKKIHPVTNKCLCWAWTVLYVSFHLKI